MFDINADIIEGDSAAGFKLGIKLKDFKRLIQARIEKINEFNGDELEISRNMESFSEVFSENGFISIYSPSAKVRFDFGLNGALYAIYLFSGYLGVWRNKINTASYLKDVCKEINLYFDEGDDLYYPDEFKGEEISGIGFQSAKEEDPLKSKLRINCIAVMNWGIR